MVGTCNDDAAAHHNGQAPSWLPHSLNLLLSSSQLGADYTQRVLYTTNSFNYLHQRQGRSPEKVELKHATTLLVHLHCKAVPGHNFHLWFLALQLPLPSLLSPHSFPSRPVASPVSLACFRLLTTPLHSPPNPQTPPARYPINQSAFSHQPCSWTLSPTCSRTSHTFPFRLPLSSPSRPQPFPFPVFLPFLYILFSFNPIPMCPRYG